MTSFRDFLAALDANGELLTINRTIDAKYELGALLKQAEARRKAILFRSVAGKSFPVIGGLLTTPARMGQALGQKNAAHFTRLDHAALINAALAEPLPMQKVASGLCQQHVLADAKLDSTQLPVPTFFEGDSGPFITAAVGVSRNPDNGVINVGIYRVLILGDNRVAVSASPSSDLARFFADAAEASITVPVALVFGADPSVLMAAAAKVPGDISELDVAGALNGKSLEVVAAKYSDLLIPADAEIVIEVEVDPQTTIENTMGEFGDYYGTQTAPVAQIKAITHRDGAMFHALMAGAGREHNNIGFIILYEIEPKLHTALVKQYPYVNNLRVYFEPPRMGVTGDVYVQVSDHANSDGNFAVEELIKAVYAFKLGMFDLARIIRRVIVVDADIDINDRQQIDWAIAVRANTTAQYCFWDDFASADGKVRIGINATANPDERDEFARLTIPGGDDIDLDDYLTS